METSWYYHDGAHQRGPVSREQLVQILLDSPDPNRVPVWHPTLPDWKTSGSVQEISQYLPPPAPSARVPPPMPSPYLPPQAQVATLPVEEAEGIARLYRRLVLLVGLQLFLSFMFPISGSMATQSQTGVVALAILLVLLVLLGAIAVTAYQLTSLLGSNWAILWAIAMFIPCLNILFLLALSANAQSWCRRYGIKVGFLGPTTESIEELRRRAGQ